VRLPISPPSQSTALLCRDRAGWGNAEMAAALARILIHPPFPTGPCAGLGSGRVSFPCMGIDHYENFPVASCLVPSHLRAPIREIYRFARCADDIADEGEAAASERLAALAALGRDLDRIEVGTYPANERWSGLAAAARAHALGLEPLRDLLRAFVQDVQGKRYRDYEDLLAYCRWSISGRTSTATMPRGGCMFHNRSSLDSAWIPRRSRSAAPTRPGCA
jgi:Squalene/phytoene synthase